MDTKSIMGILILLAVVVAGVLLADWVKVRMVKT